MVELPMPNNDPTSLTNAAILREVTHLRDLVEARFAAMDKAIELLEKYPTTVDVAISHLQALDEEKFKAIRQQFTSDKLALDAALQAAKAAATEQNQSNSLTQAKSDASFTKQIDQAAALVAQMEKNFNSQIADLKINQSIGVGRSIGVSGLMGYLIGVGGLVLGVVGAVVSLIVLNQPKP